MADSKRVRISKREGALMARLSAKEQEVYEVQASARDLYRARRPVTDFARQVYTDPAINVEFQLMTAQLAEMENSLRLKDAELKELRTLVNKDKGGEARGNAGSVAKPKIENSSDKTSAAVKLGVVKENKAAKASALVSRCQRLEQENEELAASADVAKVAQLTSEKAVAEAYAGELKTALEEAYEYIEQLEEEREVKSSKVYALEEELRAVAANTYRDQEHYHQSASQGAMGADQMQSSQTHTMQVQQPQTSLSLVPTGSQNNENEPWDEGEQQQQQQQQQQQEHSQREGHETRYQNDGAPARARFEGEARSHEYGGADVPSQPDTAEDMDDLYGDMGAEVGEGHTLTEGLDASESSIIGKDGDAVDGAATKDDPMEEEESQVRPHEDENQEQRQQQQDEEEREKAKAKREEEQEEKAKAKQEEEARIRANEDEKAKQEQEEKARQEEEEKNREEREEKAKTEEEEKEIEKVKPMATRARSTRRTRSSK